MNTPFAQTLRIKPYHCSPDGLALPHVLTLLCQDVASDHADTLGFGFAALKQRKLLWALVTLKLEISVQPRYGMELTLETWPSAVRGLRAGREFRMRDAEGNDLFLASSDWMVLDEESRRPQDVSILDLARHARPERLLGEKLSRRKPDAPGREISGITVSLSALDVNGHVNNTEYTRLAYDALRRLGPRGALRGLGMHFHSEAFLNDEIRLCLTEQEQSCCVTGYRGADAVFSALFDFACQTRSNDIREPQQL